MKLISLNRYTSFLILLFFLMPIRAEEEIDIWSKKEKKQNSDQIQVKTKDNENKLNFEIINKAKKNEIEINDKILESDQARKIFGIYDPAKNNFDLNMWSKSTPENIRSSFARINKIDLSNTALKLFENTIFSYAYPPQGMNDEEFIDLKINWLIENKRTSLIEELLEQNETFHNKKKVIQYIVDSNIARANIKAGCEKISFIDKSIKDSYLEKFKIYCLVFDNKKNEAQLLYDILQEQKKSDKFFDDKINFLLGVNDTTSNKIKDDNLLNFYLSSVTNDKFQYEPNKKTKKVIWEYLNAANLIKLEDIEDKEKLKDLEIAASKDQFDKQNIFDIYKRIPFDLNNLLNAENIYQTLNGSDSRALIYQKYLLSDNPENKIQLLFLLKELFKKDDLSNVYTKFMSERLAEIEPSKIPENYKEVVNKNIINEVEYDLGKIRYDDKILHRSKVIKYFIENTDKKRTQKDFDKIYKKIKKNRKYFYSAKDLALIESFESDGFKIPNDLNIKKLIDEYEVPLNLLQLAKNREYAFLTLKIVEIIGEDEPYQLDPETIYFITHLLNKINLKKLRNDVLISALPQRS
tara:strand:+ start:192 stop:1928 length:1737 start_codon:yes stop_codon:yes gene_type:complete